MEPIDIVAYNDSLGELLVAALWEAAVPVPGVPGLRVGAGLREAYPELETSEALSVLASVYAAVRDPLDTVLQQRVVDRAFLDAHTLRLVADNAGKRVSDADYATVIGLRDRRGRVVIGAGDGEAAGAHRRTGAEFGGEDRDVRAASDLVADGAGDG